MQVKKIKIEEDDIDELVSTADKNGTLGDLFSTMYEQQIWLKDIMIEKCIMKLLSSKTDCRFVSPVNLDRAMMYHEKQNTVRIHKTLKLKDDPSEMIIFPLFNRNASHWSCLFYSKKTKVGYHYDSMCSANERFCENVMKMLIGSESVMKNSIWRDMKSLNQERWFDCGYYVILCVFLFLCNRQEESDPIPYEFIRDSPKEHIHNAFVKLSMFLNDE